MIMKIKSTPREILPTGKTIENFFFFFFKLAPPDPLQVSGISRELIYRRF